MELLVGAFTPLVREAVLDPAFTPGDVNSFKSIVSAPFTGHLIGESIVLTIVAIMKEARERA
jgi:hypothetical protein